MPTMGKNIFRIFNPGGELRTSHRHIVLLVADTGPGVSIHNAVADASN
jgi:hypothetical protein